MSFISWFCRYFKDGERKMSVASGIMVGFSVLGPTDLPERFSATCSLFYSYVCTGRATLVWLLHSSLHQLYQHVKIVYAAAHHSSVGCSGYEVRRSVPDKSPGEISMNVSTLPGEASLLQWKPQVVQNSLRQESHLGLPEVVPRVITVFTGCSRRVLCI